MELLSPAGNLDHIDIAIKEKPDAVYGGLKNWNARNKALNFSFDEYNQSVKILHENGIKFYLTLNILLFDEEIDEIMGFLKEKCNEMPDAIIVTDLGLIKKLKKELPNIPLHFSTQFGVHNEDDLKYAEYLGAERVILARELTLDEVDNLTGKTELEIECFVWGSQCVSFSGLCFLGSAMCNGGGNRGKCITLCRDIYKTIEKEGNLLYMPDLDCINLIPDLKNVDCIKLEGRRRDKKEIASIIRQIRLSEKSKITNGYLLGEKVEANHLFEEINSRIKPSFNYKEVEIINDEDIFLEYKNGFPIKICHGTYNENSFYVFSEIKNNYDFDKKNISFEINISSEIISEILYVNHNGEGFTFFDDGINYIDFQINDFFKSISNFNPNINIYKIKYRRNIKNQYFISENMYKNIMEYIKKDLKNTQAVKLTDKTKCISNLFVETSDENIVEELLCDKSVKIIYNISSFLKLENIGNVVKKYNDSVIYKLPLFNWKSKNALEFYKLLENKEVMFTRLSQIYIASDINFKKKYADYTIYVWNKTSLSELNSFGVNSFTASPEIYTEKNLSIFKNNEIQFIIGGKIPLIYSRNCFKSLFGCRKCENQIGKDIKNLDKNLEFKIFCENDNRFMTLNQPILNNYLFLNNGCEISYRYMTYGQNINEIRKTISMIKSKNYYYDMINDDTWKSSYQCNILEKGEIK